MEERIDHGGELTERVIAAAIAVHRHFGPGFLEGTYHRAMEVELEERSIAYVSEVPIQLKYRGRLIGDGRIDLLIERRLVVELKAVPAAPKAFQRQVLAYLKATDHRLGLVINFSEHQLKDGISRVVL